MSDFKLTVLVILLSLGFSGNLSSVRNTRTYFLEQVDYAPNYFRQIIHRLTFGFVRILHQQKTNRLVEELD